MALSLPIQQQKAEMSEGQLRWKVERFLKNVKEHKSPVFKFGRHDAFLKIPAKSSEYFTGTADCSKHVYPKFEMELHITELLGLNIFSNVTYYEVCFVGNELRKGYRSSIKSGFILREESSFHLMTHRCGGSKDEIIDELLPEGTLTIQLTWYEKRNRIGPMIQDNETQTPSDLIPEKEPTKLLVTLSEDLGRFYENKTDTDCVLQVGDVQIPAHRSVLSARSGVFAAMFRHDTSENRSGVVNILDADAAVLSDTLYYVYSGKVRGLFSDTAAPMYTLADRYAIIELRDACMALLKTSLTVENVCDAALLAHNHVDADLEEKVVQFMEDNLEEIEESDKWKELLNNKPMFANKLLRSVVAACRDRMKKLLS